MQLLKRLPNVLRPTEPTPSFAYFPYATVKRNNPTTCSRTLVINIL